MSGMRVCQADLAAGTGSRGHPSPHTVGQVVGLSLTSVTPPIYPGPAPLQAIPAWQAQGSGLSDLRKALRGAVLMEAQPGAGTGHMAGLTTARPCVDPGYNPGAPPWQRNHSPLPLNIILP